MAGLGRRTFAAGEVLTASNVMGYLQDQAVMKFAGTAARGSAIGTAVAEGMTSYLTDSDLVEVYDGSVWRRHSGGLVPVGPTSVVANTGSASINAVGTVTFTGVGSLKLVGCFNASYRNYKINITFSGTNASNVVYGSWLNGTTSLNTGYFNVGDRRSWGIALQDYGSANNDSQFALYTPEITYNSGAGYSSIDVFNPYYNLASTAALSSTYSTYVGSGFNLYRTATINDTASRDGFNLFIGGGATMTGYITVYGYNS